MHGSAALCRVRLQSSQRRCGLGLGTAWDPGSQKLPRGAMTPPWRHAATAEPVEGNLSYAKIQINSQHCCKCTFTQARGVGTERSRGPQQDGFRCPFSETNFVLEYNFLGKKHITFQTYPP